MRTVVSALRCRDFPSPLHNVSLCNSPHRFIPDSCFISTPIQTPLQLKYFVWTPRLENGSLLDILNSFEAIPVSRFKEKHIHDVTASSVHAEINFTARRILKWIRFAKSYIRLFISFHFSFISNFPSANNAILYAFSRAVVHGLRFVFAKRPIATRALNSYIYTTSMYEKLM